MEKRQKNRRIGWKVGNLTAIMLIVGNQTNAIIQVNDGINQISSVVQTDSATSEESAAASEQLSAQAGLLKRLIGSFRFR